MFIDFLSMYGNPKLSPLKILQSQNTTFGLLYQPNVPIALSLIKGLILHGVCFLDYPISSLFNKISKLAIVSLQVHQVQGHRCPGV